MRLYPRLERNGEKLAPLRVFWGRVGISLLWVLGIAIGWLLLGAALYLLLRPEDSWPLAFHRAAMIVSGMGPVGEEPLPDCERVFVDIYSLLSGLVIVGIMGFLLTPVFHRLLHPFHLPDSES